MGSLPQLGGHYTRNYISQRACQVHGKKRNEVEKRGKRDRKKRIFQKPIVAVNVTKDRAVLRTVFEQRISKTDSLPFSERNILFGYLPFDVLCWLSWHRDYWPGSQQVIEHLHVRGEYRV